MTIKQIFFKHIICVLMVLCFYLPTEVFANKTASMTEVLQLAAAVVQTPLAVMSEQVRHEKTTKSHILRLSTAFVRLAQVSLSAMNHEYQEENAYNHIYLLADDIANVFSADLDLIKSIKSQSVDNAELEDCNVEPNAPDQAPEGQELASTSIYKKARMMLAGLEGFAAMANALLIQKTSANRALRLKIQSVAALCRALNEYLFSESGTVKEKVMLCALLVNTCNCFLSFCTESEDFKWVFHNSMTGRFESFNSFEAFERRRQEVYDLRFNMRHEQPFDAEQFWHAADAPRRAQQAENAARLAREAIRAQARESQPEPVIRFVPGEGAGTGVFVTRGEITRDFPRDTITQDGFAPGDQITVLACNDVFLQDSINHWDPYVVKPCPSCKEPRLHHRERTLRVPAPQRS